MACTRSAVCLRFTIAPMPSRKSSTSGIRPILSLLQQTTKRVLSLLAHPRPQRLSFHHQQPVPLTVRVKQHILAESSEKTLSIMAIGWEEGQPQFHVAAAYLKISWPS